jgi:LPXTG-motif cell wall-anchored protein
MLAALAAGAIALAAPAAALAQSAGDEQYADPFGKVEKKKSSSNQGSSGTQSQTGQPTQSQPQAQAAQTQTQSTSSSELPRTGGPAGLLAATGAALLGSGGLLRRRVA